MNESRGGGGVGCTAVLKRTIFRHAFHHELFHVADFAYDGELYEDRVWNDLNSPGFR